MKFNLGIAIDAIKQKSWWKWCLILIPFTYVTTIVQMKDLELFKTIHWIWVPLFLVSLCLIPAYNGFIVTYAKKFAHTESETIETVSFKELYITGIKFLSFLFLLSIITTIFVALILFSTTMIFGWITLPLLLIYKFLSVIATTLIISIAYLVAITISAIYTITANILFIETQNILTLFKFKEIWYLFKNNKLDISKLIGWLSLITLLMVVPQIIITIVSTISPTIIGIGGGLIAYATGMMTFNMYGQIIKEKKIQIEELNYLQ